MRTKKIGRDVRREREREKWRIDMETIGWGFMERKRTYVVPSFFPKNVYVLVYAYNIHVFTLHKYSIGG